MRFRNRLVRLFRALSEESQTDFGERVGVHPTLIAEHEMGRIEPSAETLERIAGGVNLTTKAGENILRYADTLRQARLRSGDLEGLGQHLTEIVTGVYQRLLRLPIPEVAPSSADRQRACDQWLLLIDLPEDQQLAVVRNAREFQNWALAERLCEESLEQVSRDLQRAVWMARLACETADRVRGPGCWCYRIKGYAVAHRANLLRVSGNLTVADTALLEARHLWEAGADPQQILDPGRLLDLEAALRRAQRRFPEALSLLDRAKAISHYPERSLIMKGFTLEAMGEYQGAIDALLEAEPLLNRETEPRSWYQQHFNLAVNYCHLERFTEACSLVDQVQEVVTALGDDIFQSRVTWLEGRIAAGLGRPMEARRLLAQARQEFAAREMGYDVALALLEEAILLLAGDRTVEVKELALDLKTIFVSKGVHREALAALQLFQEAAEREAATAELGRSVLRYLFRARYDEGLRFEAT